MNKKNKVLRIVIILILVFITFLSMLTLNDFKINLYYLLSLIVLYYIYSRAYPVNFIQKREALLSVFLSLLVVIGRNFKIFGDFYTISLKLVLVDILVFLGSFLLIYSILILLLRTTLKDLEMGSSKIITFIEKHFIILSILFIILCRLPFLIASFPSFSTRDTLDSVCQIINNRCSWSIMGLNLKDPDVFLNNHHPFLFTFIIGLFMKTSNPNIGFFLYIIFQNIILISIFVYLLNYMKKEEIPLFLRIIALLFISLNPMIQSYSFVAVKDTLSAIFTLLYVVFLYKIVINYDCVYKNKLNIFMFIITMILVLLFRHNGLITIVLSYPCLFLLYKEHKRKILAVFIIPIIFAFTFNQIIYNVFDASKGSKSEMLYLPFLQIARVIKVKGENVFLEEDKKVIDKVISFSKVADRYNTTVGDFVKVTYKKSSSDEDLKKFLIVWGKYFVKYPGTYIAHFINSTYMYYYPSDSFKDFEMQIDGGVRSLYKIKQYNISIEVNKYLTLINNNINKVPFILLLYNVGIYSWVLFISCFYLIYNKMYKYLIVYTPLIATFLVNLASPLNGSIRYSLPIIYAMPIVLMINYAVLKEKDYDRSNNSNASIK